MAAIQPASRDTVHEVMFVAAQPLLHELSLSGARHSRHTCYCPLSATSKSNVGAADAHTKLAGALDGLLGVGVGRSRALRPHTTGEHGKRPAAETTPTLLTVCQLPHHLTETFFFFSRQLCEQRTRTHTHEHTRVLCATPYSTNSATCTCTPTCWQLCFSPRRESGRVFLMSPHSSVSSRRTLLDVRRTS